MALVSQGDVPRSGRGPLSFARHGPDGVAVTVFRADGQGRRWRQLTDSRSSF